MHGSLIIGMELRISQIEDKLSDVEEAKKLTAVPMIVILIVSSIQVYKSHFVNLWVRGDQHRGSLPFHSCLELIYYLF